MEYKDLIKSDFLRVDVERWYNALSDKEKDDVYSEIMCRNAAIEMVDRSKKDEEYQKREKILRILNELRARPKVVAKSKIQPSKEGGASNRRMLNGTKGIMEEFGWKSQTTALFYKNNVFAPAVFQPKKGGKFQVDAEMARELMNEFNEKNKTSD